METTIQLPLLPTADQTDDQTLKQAARALLEACKYEKKFAFFGEMGAGKTTLIKAICEELGVTDTANSPTYAIINEYSNGQPVFHLDLYRLEDEQEAVDSGVLECLDGPHYCLIEWPERISGYLDETVVRVEIALELDGSRTVTINR